MLPHHTSQNEYNSQVVATNIGENYATFCSYVLQPLSHFNCMTIIDLKGAHLLTFKSQLKESVFLKILLAKCFLE